MEGSLQFNLAHVPGRRIKLASPSKSLRLSCPCLQQHLKWTLEMHAISKQPCKDGTRSWSRAQTAIVVCASLKSLSKDPCMLAFHIHLFIVELLNFLQMAS